MNNRERDFKHLLPEEYFFGFNKQGDEEGALIVYENSERSLAREYHWKNGIHYCVGCKNFKKTLNAKVTEKDVRVPKQHFCQPETIEEIKKRQLSFKNLSIYGQIDVKELEKYSDVTQYKKFEKHEYETPTDGSLVVYADRDKNMIYEYGKLTKKWFCKGCAKLKKKEANTPTQYGGFINMELYLPKRHICRPFYYQISDDSESDEESMVDKLINKYHLKEVNSDNIEFCPAMSGRNDKYRMVICSKDRSRVREYHLKPSTDDIWLCKNCEKADVKDIYAVSKDGVIYASKNHRCQKIKYSEIVLARRNINNYSIHRKEAARDNDDLEMPLPSNNETSSDSADESRLTPRQQRTRTVGNLEYGRQRSSSPVPCSSRTRLRSNNDEHAAAAPIVPNRRVTRSRTEEVSRKRSQINEPIAAKSTTTISNSSNGEPVQKRVRVRPPRSRTVEHEDFEDFHVQVQPITSSPIPCSSKTLLYQTNQQAGGAPQIRNIRGPASRTETIDHYPFEESVDDGNTTVRALQRIFNNSSPQVDSPQPNENLTGTFGNRKLSATRVNFGQGRVDDFASIRRNIDPANIIRMNPPPRNNGAIPQQQQQQPLSSNILQPINENELIGKVEALASFIEERNENVRNEDRFNENRENEVPVIPNPQNHHPNILQQQNVLDDQNVHQIDEVHNVEIMADDDIQIYAEHIIPASQHLLEQKFKPAVVPEPSFPVNVPSDEFLKLVLKKLKIDFTRNSLNFWSKLLIEEVKNSSIPENTKFFESQTETFFKCLSLFLTGNADSYDLNIKIAFQNYLYSNLNSFEPFDGIDFAKMKHTSKEFIKMYSCDEITKTHLYLISKWMRCRFFIFVNGGGWEKLGSWENDNQIFILQKNGNFFQPILNLK